MRTASHGRGRRRSFTVALVAAVVSLFGVAAATAATLEGGDDNTALSVSRFQKVDPGSVGVIDGHGATNWVPASVSDKQVSVMLKMSGAPVAARGNLNASEKASVRAQLKDAQDGIAKDVARAGATIVGQTQDAYNGILVHVKQKDVAALESLPGVTGIQPVGLYDQPSNVNGVPLVGGPAAWGGVPGLTGHGVTIGIIDTGIDYTHADFGGPGTPAAYTAAHAASTVAPAPGSFDPNKFGGGYDFVGDSYDANVAGSVPQPDPNPLDCNGHGSHTAGTAAGYGVTASGHTYTGPYNASTVSGNSWLVGPGVAPQAKINEYRVFGCTGSSDVVILAINKAVADGVNVISMSLGSPFGGSDQNDAEATAVNNAVAAGITVVASAGNSGPAGYIVGSPSTANHALSVAANDGSVSTYPGGLFHLSATSSISGINANGATFSNGLSAPVKVLRDATGGVSLGCDPAEYVNQGASGKIVVVQRGTCARVARAIYGQKAGAVAVVMINNSTALPPYEGQITSNPDTGEAYTVTIPFFGVKGLATTGADAQALIAADGKTISIDNTTVPNSTYLATASFSSGGPRNGDSAAKPEITAPGVSVTSVLVGGGTKGTVMSGTSMACPMTAGAAALVKQAHPTWSGDQIKAALVNTASTASNLIAGYNGRLNGTGFVQADKAATTTGLMTTADGLDSLSFGYVGGTGNYTDTRSFTISNTGSSAVTYNLASSSSLVTLSAPSVTVPAGGSQTVTATLTIPSGTFAALPSASTFSTGWGGVVTSRGLVTATPTGGGQVLRMQSLVAPRGLSNVSASAAAPFVKQANNNVYTSSTTVANAGVHAGTADVYAWGITDPKDLPAGSAQDIRDVGVQGPFSDGTLVFAVNGWNASSTQATQEYDIAIDLQHDGKPDYYVVGADNGVVTTGTFDGRFASFTIDAKTNKVIDEFVADAPMNGSTALLATNVADLGLHAANTSFNYAVSGFSIFGGAVDTTAAASFDTSKPGVSTGQFATLNPGASASIPLAADYDKLQSAPALGWLVVNVDDAGGAGSADEVALPPLK